MPMPRSASTADKTANLSFITMPILYAGIVAPKKRERATRGGIIQSFVNESEAEQPAARKDEGEPMLYCPVAPRA